MRSRSNGFCFRLNDDEAALFHQKLEASGLSQREFLIRAITDTPIQPKEYYEELRKMNGFLYKIYNAIRLTGNCVNQMARVANSTGELPTGRNLAELQHKLDNLQKAWDVTWRYIRSRIQNH